MHVNYKANHDKTWLVFIFRLSVTFEVHAKVLLRIVIQFLARLFSKKTSRYCHSPGVFRRLAKTSVITEDIYLKLRVVVHY